MKLFQSSKKEESEENIEKNRIKSKMERIKQAKQVQLFLYLQHEDHRKPNPQQGILFSEEDWIRFTVFQDSNKVKLQTYRSQPDNEPKAFVFLFHGLCAHMNHGGHLAKQMNEIGCIVIGFDHRGFGKSEGLRGYVENLDIHLQDSNHFIDMVLAHYAEKGIKDLPIFLMGLSMGGMTSFRLSIEKPERYRGIVMFAPAIKPIQGKTVLKMVKLLGKVMPKYKLLKPKKGMTTKNPQISDDLSKDQFTYSEEMRPGTAETILSTMDESQRMFNKLTVPWCLVQGGLDKLVDPDLADQLEKESPSTDKRVYFYKDCWHDIWHEQEILDAMPKVVQWLKERF